jgi:hypothetical protein
MAYNSNNLAMIKDNPRAKTIEQSAINIVMVAIPDSKL